MSQSRLTVVYAIALLGLVACGGGGSSGSSPEPDGSAPVTETTDDAAGGSGSETGNAADNAGGNASDEAGTGTDAGTATDDSPTDNGIAPTSFVHAGDSNQAETLAPPEVKNFGSGATFNRNFASDPDYDSAIQVSSGQGFGAGVHVGFIAFTDYADGFVSGFDKLHFKIKANAVNLRSFEVKFFLPDNSRRYDLTQTKASISELDNGWLQVSIPMSDFAGTIAQSDGFLLGPFEGQQAAFSYLLTDIGFSRADSSSDDEQAGGSDTGEDVETDPTDSGTGNGSGSGSTPVDTGGNSGNGDNSGGSDSDSQPVKALYDQNTVLEPIDSKVRDDGVIVTRFGDRGRDRHAKDNGSQDHYDHYLAHYWQYRTARIQLEDHTANGQSLIRATYITEEELSSREFRVWFWGVTTSAQYHLNPQPTYVGRGTWNNDFVKVSSTGRQHMYQLDITRQWQNGGQFQNILRAGMNMEFEISQFLRSPPAGSRLNYYGTTFVYVVGQPGLAPFEWTRGENKQGGSNDGTPLPQAALLGGDGTLGYNYSAEPAGRFMQMATNLSHRNAQPFVRGRRVHHTNFVNGGHDERFDNPVWNEQIGKAGNRYINHSCSGCHVRNGRAVVADVGETLNKWVFKIGDAAGGAHPQLGKTLQPILAGGGASEGNVQLGRWTELSNGLRQPSYVFENGAPPRFSARIAPQLVGVGLLEAVSEAQILAFADPDDANGDGISGRASLVEDPSTGELRLGRFGYKAATVSVKHQAAAALNTDMGVMTSLLPSPDCGSEQVNCDNTGVELADGQLNDLVKYLSLLGVGARRDYADTAGETIFGDLGCSGCHRPNLNTSTFHPLAELRDQSIQPYTDLLLHDMGDGLADNLGEGSASGREWRTAPLWGLGHARSVMLGDSKANDNVSLAQDSNDINRIGYLHDGRARTIDEAIRWHGGEAAASKDAYVSLTTAEQQALLRFLNGL